MNEYTVLFNHTGKMFTLYRENLKRNDLSNIVSGLISDMECYPVWNDEYTATCFKGDRMLFTVSGELNRRREKQLWDPDGSTVIWILNHITGRQRVYKDRMYKLFTVHQINHAEQNVNQESCIDVQGIVNEVEKEVWA